MKANAISNMCATREMTRCLRDANRRGIWHPGLGTLDSLRFWRTPRGELYATQYTIDMCDGRRVAVEYDRGAGYRAS